MAVQRKGQTLLEENRIGDEEESDFDSEPESESESEQDDEDEEVKLAEPSKTAAYNAQGILDKLADIRWPENADWTHKLSVDVEQGQEVDVNDDLARELSFYNQALEGAKAAFEKLEAVGLPFLRPPDYYAEMVKTDSHMEKVKGRLLAEKRRVEEAEERRKARDSKRLSKEVQSAKQRERAKQKKDDIESVKKWRKQRQKSGFARDGGDDAAEEMGFEFEDGKPFERSGGKKRLGVGPGDRSGGKRRSFGGGNGKQQRKRERKDSKFGFGGRKASNKQNNAESTSNVRGFGGFKSDGNKKRKV